MLERKIFDIFSSSAQGCHKPLCLYQPVLRLRHGGQGNHPIGIHLSDKALQGLRKLDRPVFCILGMPQTGQLQPPSLGSASDTRPEVRHVEKCFKRLRNMFEDSSATQLQANSRKPIAAGSRDQVLARGPSSFSDLELPCAVTCATALASACQNGPVGTNLCQPTAHRPSSTQLHALSKAPRYVEIRVSTQ